MTEHAVPEPQLKDFKDVMALPHRHALRYFERSSKRTTTDLAECGSNVHAMLLGGPRMMGIQLTVRLITPEAKFHIQCGIQFHFERDLDLTKDLLADCIEFLVLPTIMPIAAAWMISESEALGVVAEIPMTEAYPTIGKNLRDLVMAQERVGT